MNNEKWEKYRTTNELIYENNIETQHNLHYNTVTITQEHYNISNKNECKITNFSNKIYNVASKFILKKIDKNNQ